MYEWKDIVEAFQHGVEVGRGQVECGAGGVFCVVFPFVDQRGAENGLRMIEDKCSLSGDVIKADSEFIERNKVGQEKAS